MKRRFRHLLLLLAGLVSACSVMPATVRNEALPAMPYDELVRNAAQYQGRTVIVGGYVIDVQNEAGHTALTLLQTPLGITQKPRKKDLSRGRLLLTYKGFLDPEIYTKDRVLTVAGKVTGSSALEKKVHPFPYLRLEVETLHLWSVEKPLPPDAYWDPWWPPYYRWRHPYYYRYR